MKSFTIFEFCLFVDCFLISDAFESSAEFDRIISNGKQPLTAIGDTSNFVGLENSSSNASTSCNDLKKCNNRGRCYNSACLCQPGTSGPFCSSIDGCKELNCGDEKTVECAYDERNFKAYCKCKNWDHSYDNDARECKACKCDNCAGPICLSEALSCQFVRGEKKCVCREPNNMYNPKSQKCEFCYCGGDDEARSCSFDDYGNKNCECEYKYKVKGIYCERCDCGYHGDCYFDGYEQNCKCYEGYSDNHGYCEPCGCGENGKCVFDNYRTTGCNCDRGYTEIDGKCVEVCYCGDNANCTIESGKKICLCPEGFQNVNGLCTDINECDDPSACPLHMDCSNMIGSYNCTCKNGFKTLLEDPGKCEDINECLSSNPCSDPLSECFNTVGSFKCICKPGYAIRQDATSPISCESKTSWKLGFGLLIGISVAVIIVLMTLIYRRYRYT